MSSFQQKIMRHTKKKKGKCDPYPGRLVNRKLSKGSVLWRTVYSFVSCISHKILLEMISEVIKISLRIVFLVIA